MPKLILTILLIALLSACKKKEPETPPEQVPVPVIPSDIPACASLPAPPKPFGWTDSTKNEEQNVLAFNYSPVSPDEIIYITGGDIYGYYPVFKLDIISGNTTKIGNSGLFLPSISKTNWMLFSTIDNNLVKVKCNGDSMMQLSSDFKSIAPKWDYTGKQLYFFKQADLFSGSFIQKIGANGETFLKQFPADLPYFCSYTKSDKLLYCQTNNTLVTLVERDVPTDKERTLISGPFDPKSGKTHFNHLCIDNNDQFAYYANSLGIFRLNLSNLAVDTLFLNCDSRTFDCPQINTQTGELTFSVHSKTALSTTVLFHQYKTMVSPPRADEATLVRLFPD